MILLVLVLVGLCLGSFVNALVWRLHEHKDWINGRSECPHCHHVLAAKDLVPVLSWLWLRGKCRYCHKPIPDTPLPELAVPTLFVLSYAFWPEPLQGAAVFRFVLWLLCLVLFVVLAVYDLKWLLLPNKVVFPLMGLAVVWVLGSWLWDGPWHTLANSGLGAFAVAGLFFLLFQLSKGKWIGFGDVKLAVALGLLAGNPVRACLLLLFASLVGVLISLPLVALGKAGRKSKLPFGPLLLAGMVFVQLFGADVINWYSSLLLG